MTMTATVGKMERTATLTPNARLQTVSATAAKSLSRGGVPLAARAKANATRVLQGIIPGRTPVLRTPPPPPPPPPRSPPPPPPPRKDHRALQIRMKGRLEVLKAALPT